MMCKAALILLCSAGAIVILGVENWTSANRSLALRWKYFTPVASHENEAAKLLHTTFAFHFPSMNTHALTKASVENAMVAARKTPRGPRPA